MGRTSRLTAVLSTALALAACSGPSKRTAEPTPPGEAERAYPALAWVPPDASWALVATRPSALADALRELYEPLAIAAGRQAAELDVELGRLLGKSPLRAADLEEIGLDGSGGVALFGGPDGLPTAVVSIGDPDRLRAYLDGRRPEQNVSSTLHRGHELYGWQQGSAPRISWVLLDGWLVVHLGAADEGPAWLDAVLAAGAGRGLGDEPELAEALARGRALASAIGPDRPGGPPTAIGIARPALLAALGRLPGDEARCAAALAGAITSVTVAGDLRPDGGGMELSLGLSPAAAAALAGAIGPPALPGLRGYRASAGVHLSLALDLDWLSGAIRGAGCRLAPPFGDPLAAFTGRAGARAYHLAAQDLDVEDLSGRLMAHLALRDPRFFEDQLDAIPGRRFLERKRQVAGVEVRVLDSLPGVPTVAYRLTADSLLAAVGDGMIGALLGAGPEAPAGREVASAGLFPGRLPKLGHLLGLAAGSLGLWNGQAHGEAAARRLRRYEWIGGDVVLEGDRLVLSAAMRLRK
jgi:hypothetical protein